VVAIEMQPERVPLRDDVETVTNFARLQESKDLRPSVAQKENLASSAVETSVVKKAEDVLSNQPVVQREGEDIPILDTPLSESMKQTPLPEDLPSEEVPLEATVVYSSHSDEEVD